MSGTAALNAFGALVAVGTLDLRFASLTVDDGAITPFTASSAVTPYGSAFEIQSAVQSTKTLNAFFPSVVSPSTAGAL